MSIIPFVVVEHEVIELVLLDALAPNHPEQERAYRISLHQTVEETFDLLGPPHKLTLDGGKHVLPAFDSSERLQDRDRGLKCHAGEASCT